MCAPMCDEGEGGARGVADKQGGQGSILSAHIPEHTKGS